MSSRHSKDSATPRVNEALDTDAKQDQGDTEIDQLVTPGAQRAQSERSKERVSPATYVKYVEGKRSDNDQGNEGQTHQEPDKMAANPIPAPTEAIKEASFELKKDKMKEPDIPTYNYTNKYPRDRRYEELHDDARVWHAYNEEAAISDDNMVVDAGDDPDILLVFAGLFSAVLTTFVAQTSQSLSPDNSAITVSLLTELIAVQRAGFAGASLSDIPPADVTPTITRTNIWVNALWFTSLALSLASALLAALSKQWLRQYRSIISGTARERALIRQFRYDGVEKCALRTITGLLPTVLHVALALFLVGLVLFLAPLDRGIATSVGIISGVIFVAYFTTIVIAIVDVQSPYRTTFSNILSTWLRWLFNIVYPVFQTRLALGKVSLVPTARAAERTRAVCLDEYPGATQACHALLWLHNITKSMSAKILIMNSLGTFPATFFDGDEQQTIFVKLSNGCGPSRREIMDWKDYFPHKTAHDFELMLRTLCHSSHTGHLSINRDNVRDLRSDPGLALAYAALGGDFPLQIQHNEGGVAKLPTLRALFFTRASDILSLLPLDHSSYVNTLYSLGSAPPLVWSHLIKRSPCLDSLSPSDLYDWPLHEVDLQEYLDLIYYAHSQPDQSLSVFQNPVEFCTFLRPIFEKLGWYDIPLPVLWIFRKSVPPRLDDTVDNEDDCDLMADSPPPDKDAVWEPAVYPMEWPPYPAPTYAEALMAAEAEWEVEEAKGNPREARREAEREWEGREKKAREGAELKALLAGVMGLVAEEAEIESEGETEQADVEGGFGRSGIQKFVREKLRSGGERARDMDIV